MADNVIHRLSLVGYWSNPTVPPERSRGWPDPRDLTGAWDGADRLATLAHLRRGKVFRVFAGASECRICATALGSLERSDGVWAWPDGLEHYVDAHDIRLPEAFVTACRHPEWSVPAWLDSVDAQLWVQCGESAAPEAAADAPTWTVDDSAWLDWPPRTRQLVLPRTRRLWPMRARSVAVYRIRAGAVTQGTSRGGGA